MFLSRRTFDPAVLDVLVPLLVDRFVAPIGVPRRMTFAEIGIGQCRMRLGGFGVGATFIIARRSAAMLVFRRATRARGAFFSLRHLDFPFAVSPGQQGIRKAVPAFDARHARKVRRPRLEDEATRARLSPLRSRRCGPSFAASGAQSAEASPDHVSLQERHAGTGS